MTLPIMYVHTTTYTRSIGEGGKKNLKCKFGSKNECSLWFILCTSRRMGAQNMIPNIIGIKQIPRRIERCLFPNIWHGEHDPIEILIGLETFLPGFTRSMLPGNCFAFVVIYTPLALRTPFCHSSPVQRWESSVTFRLGRKVCRLLWRCGNRFYHHKPSFILNKNQYFRSRKDFQARKYSTLYYTKDLLHRIGYKIR